MIPPAGTPITAGHTFTADEAQFIVDLAQGKYDSQVSTLGKWLDAGAKVIPVLGTVSVGLRIFLKLNKLTSPAGPLVSDGAGGWVPETNSHFDPKTGQFIN